MSSWNKAKNGLKMFETVVHGLETIQQLASVGGDKTQDALQAIAAIVHALRDGFDGKVTPETVHFEIEALRDRIAANNAAADEKLRRKFDGEAP